MRKATAIKNQTKTMPRSKGTAKGVKGTEGKTPAGRAVRKPGGIAMKPGKYGSSGFTQRMEKKDGAV
jgi:hypothetical protein